ncbi:MAG: glycosyltransferase [Gallionella sp.]|nr:glycosyltransferase [Gallionella sp.]
MRFLITPNLPTTYDQRMVNGLAAGFHVIGHQAYALPKPISAVEVAKKCRELSIDAVIQVNRTRHPDVALPSNVRYISWFQDVFPETTRSFAESFHDSDILYALGDAEVLGLDTQMPCYVGSLVSGVDNTAIEYSKDITSDPVDFSLCGFIPTPPAIVTYNFWPDILALSRCNPLLGALRFIAISRRILIGRYFQSFATYTSALTEMMGIVSENYRPLRGDLDIHKLVIAMREATAHLAKSPSVSGSFAGKPSDRQLSDAGHLIGWFRNNMGWANRKQANDFHSLPRYERSINYFAREYPRLLDRKALVNSILQVSHSLELYGPGWNMHPEFSPYAKGTVDTQDGLLDIYRRSRINLANNTHGLGLHSRTLECMAAGGFIFTHASPHDNKPGGMLTSFEPGVHYGVFTPENLQEEAHRWLADDAGRKRAGQLAAAIVRERHCWHHRARQILDDLRK